MTWSHGLGAALVVLWVGAFAPGCNLFPGDDASIGRFCASPLEGGEYCVSAKMSPRGAWEDAKARGSLPIEMWAEWPRALTLDEVVANREKLAAWLGDVDTVLFHLRHNARSAESYRASMGGKLGALLKEARRRQEELLAQSPVEAIGNFKGAMTEKAKAVKDPLVATIASDKQAMGEVRGIFDQVKADVGPLEAAYSTLVADFSAYRKTEEAEKAAYAKLAKEASVAGLDALEKVEEAILAASLEASKKPDELTLAALKLSGQIQPFEVASAGALGPHADFLATHGAALPDMTSGAQRSINAMLGYMGQRVKRSDGTATALLANIALRRQALVLLEAAPPARHKATVARYANASSAFEAMADARLGKLAAGSEMNAKLGLPYLAKRYGELLSLLQMKPLCAKGALAWGEAGCAKLGGHFDGIAAELGTGLPAKLKAGIAAMRAKGVEKELLDAAEAKLLAGDVKGAATIHDAALRGAEGT